MNEKDTTALRWTFGLVIFLFSLALAYFAASYMESSHLLDYWPALAAFAICYVIVAVLLWSVSAVSMGFLFSADVLILNLLFENYGKWNDASKAVLIAILLVILYVVAAVRLKDDEIKASPMSM
ncbi:MAG: hypothetical protein RLZZ324_640 [Candidatus Parcubacteria bacterium]